MIFAHLGPRRMILLVQGPAERFVARGVSVQLQCNPLLALEGRTWAERRERWPFFCKLSYFAEGLRVYAPHCRPEA